MARNLGRKLMNQISAEIFASGTSGKLGSNTGLAGSSQIYKSSEEMNWFLPMIGLHVLMISVLGICYKAKDDEVKYVIKERDQDEALRKRMEINGVNGEFCEAKIADIKQKMGPASTLETERTILEVYERWMQVVSRGQGQK